MDAHTLELIYKAINSIGVALLIYFVKEFKTDIRKLTDGLTSVSMSLNTLLTKDTHKDEAIVEIKQQVAKSQKDIQNLKIRVALLEKESERTGD